MKKTLVLVVLLLPLLAAAPPQSDIDPLVNQEFSSLESLYQELHSHPELSYFEVNTSARIADELRKAGFEVTENFGKYEDASLSSHGIVAVMKNGNGPTVLVRTDLDALPVEEKTNLPYASKVKTKDRDGQEVSVMHACGHDMHMTVFVGTARVLSALKDHWKGTLIMIGQPAEEVAPGGAEAMLRDGLYKKFPRPDYCLALHNDATLASGKVGWVEGYALANVDTVDITVRGAGGHGAYPQYTKDPVVIASEVVLALQTIVSREVPPGEMAVVTVGSIHGGTKHNIIPDEVKLQLTVRSYKKEVRDLVLNSIQRITKAIAQAGGVPADREPVIDIHPEKLVPATYNNPDLVKRTVQAFQAALGKDNVVQRTPVGGGEDFSWYSLEDLSIPSFLFWLGSVPESKIKDSQQSGKQLPSLHSSLFAPNPEPSIRTGVKAMTVAVLNLMGPTIKNQKH
jgi:hippurate hydrolase